MKAIERAAATAWVPGAVRWLRSRAEAEHAFASMTRVTEAVEALVRADGGASAYCRGCGEWHWLEQPVPAAGEWQNIMEGLICQCGLNGRMRGILAAVDALLVVEPALERAVVFEQVTPLFPKLRQRIKSLVGSEYLGDGYAPGEIGEAMGQRIRHESMLAPSFADGSLDLVMHFDVLEHVPDPLSALQSCHRILSSGGWMLYSTPFYEDLDQSIVRARLGERGVIHDLEPCYHGNPVDGGGALVFTQFGWDLLDTIRNAGFDEAGLLFCFDPAEGVLSDGCPFPDGHAWPVVFAARK